MSAAITLGLLAGCATTTGKPGYDVLSTRRPTEPLPADAVFPATGGDWIYLVTAGAGAGERLARRREESGLYDATWSDREADRRSEYSITTITRSRSSIRRSSRPTAGWSPAGSTSRHFRCG